MLSSLKCISCLRSLVVCKNDNSSLWHGISLCHKFCFKTFMFSFGFYVLDLYLESLFMANLNVCINYLNRLLDFFWFIPISLFLSFLINKSYLWHPQRQQIFKLNDDSCNALYRAFVLQMWSAELSHNLSGNCHNAFQTYKWEFWRDFHCAEFLQLD